MKIIKGDLIKLAENDIFDVILYTCSCDYFTINSDVINKLKNEYPFVYKKYYEIKKKDIYKLGTCRVNCIQKSNKSYFIINAYIKNFSNDVIDYDALRNCFKYIAKTFSGLRFGYSEIDGDWNIISNIINEELKDQNHSLVIYTK